VVRTIAQGFIQELSMKNYKLPSFILGAALATGLVACNESGAKVLEAKAVTHDVKTPREECSDQAVTAKKPVKDDHRITGTVLGAVAGAVVGHQIGHGTGQDIATVAGAAGGGYAGNRVQKNIQDKNTVQTTERVCNTVYDSHSEETGSYRVRYELNGKEGTVTMDHDPGSSIPVKNGQLVL
jgi:uncharacterized protein YcfJ